MNRPAFELADIVRAQGHMFLEKYGSVINYQQLKALRAIRNCRTAALGHHVDVCPKCEYTTQSYNSCLMGSIWLWGVPGEKEEFGGLFDAFGVRFCSP
jgi:hypothetical protein